MKPISILAVVPTQSDATSFYRAGGPLSHLARNFDVKVNLASMYNWFSIGFSEIVFMQRPYTKDHLQIAEMVSRMGSKLWIDYDDDLFNLTADNPAYHTYQNEQTQSNITKIMEMCDVMTVSTEDLKTKAEKNPLMKGKVVVIRNAMPSHIVPWKKHLKRNSLVLWRGSHTHQRDVMSVANEIMEQSKKHDKWTWEFIGGTLWFMTENMPDNRTLCVEPIDIQDYFDHIHMVAPAVIIAPLVNTSFNRAKSNIAWLEGIYAGAVCVGPDLPEWKVPGCLRYEDPEHFGVLMHELLSQEPQAIYNEYMKSAYEYAMEFHNLDKVNMQRMAVIQALMSKGEV